MKYVCLFPSGVGLVPRGRPSLQSSNLNPLSVLRLPNRPSHTLVDPKGVGGCGKRISCTATMMMMVTVSTPPTPHPHPAHSRSHRHRDSCRTYKIRGEDFYLFVVHRFQRCGCTKALLRLAVMSPLHRSELLVCIECG